MCYKSNDIVQRAGHAAVGQSTESGACGCHPLHAEVKSLCKGLKSCGLYALLQQNYACLCVFVSRAFASVFRRAKQVRWQLAQA